MKKFLNLTLLALMVISLLAGCGASSMVADKYAPMENEIAVESPAAPMPKDFCLPMSSLRRNSRKTSKP